MFDWITSFIDSVGPLGVAIMMFVENVFPPIPSEVIMPLAGYSASQKDASVLLLVVNIIAGSIGSLAGAILWFWIGAKVGLKRIKRFSRDHGRWLTMTPSDVDKADEWFDRYGARSVFIGRLIPTVRTFVSVPAGMAGMGWTKFLIYTSAGTVLWTTALTLAGWFLGSQYEQVSTWLSPVSTAVVVGLLAWYLYRVATFRKRVDRSDEATAAKASE
ncbi:DedA family protein [Marivita sp. S2033]|uniref:DedA family protein n=1 Tax=Marivita sp. S2033 TaxID=3373187 RepID=UPI003982BCDC